MGPLALSLDSVDFGYGRRNILTRVFLEVANEQSVSIAGRSGSGKSTLLAVIAGLLRASHGSVVVLGQRVDHMRKGDLARFRRHHLGIVFQSGELLPAMSAVENVAMPLLLDGSSWPAAEEAARTLLSRTGVAVESHDLPASSLSGGERQRAALARAIITEPELIIADEPTGSLDTETRNEVADLLFSLPTAYGCALLVVTHDREVAARADRQLILDNGVLLATATMANS